MDETGTPVNVPTVTAASKTVKRRKNKRVTGSPTQATQGKRNARSVRSHPTPLPLRTKAKRFRWRKIHQPMTARKKQIRRSTNQRKMTDNMEMNPAMELDNELVNGMDNNTEQQPTGTETEQPLPQDDSRLGTPHLTNF
ncbi:hypothetical protein TNCV_2546541 [Trichonephila clavipes]|nr:hypothetical protein TNCV_2546541 [Trichonephila clavipes]